MKLRTGFILVALHLLASCTTTSTTDHVLCPGEPLNVSLGVVTQIGDIEVTDTSDSSLLAGNVQAHQFYHESDTPDYTESECCDLPLNRIYLSAVSDRLLVIDWSFDFEDLESLSVGQQLLTSSDQGLFTVPSGFDFATIQECVGKRLGFLSLGGDGELETLCEGFESLDSDYLDNVLVTSMGGNVFQVNGTTALEPLGSISFSFQLTYDTREIHVDLPDYTYHCVTTESGCSIFEVNSEDCASSETDCVLIDESGQETELDESLSFYGAQALYCRDPDGNHETLTNLLED